ncbi:probable serine/threonine-protein kinase ndrC isoform X2 [Mya arenaria]|uniref:probable serine/threonine-protein kinase ndrC isoform X2 n=1 Tax=Mya arenaria TaxID=6604 RepID=UPI0022E12731|nr:probable serine/threonine-protein kinase ndrC isoform X2 [Mya arenaria]
MGLHLGILRSMFCQVLELNWKCPGRRPPGSENEEKEVVKEETVTTPVKTEEQRPAIPNEFDFDDDDGPNKTVITPRRTPGSAPRSQKKVARMDKVLKDMMQQRKLQAAEREARKQATAAKSPRNPSSPGRARIGSPAGSPRTPPAAGGGSNRQSPVRFQGPTDGLQTTPLRPPQETQTTGMLKPSHSVNETSTASVGSPAVKTDMTTSAVPTNQPTFNNQTTLVSRTQGTDTVNTQQSLFSQSQPQEAVATPVTKESETVAPVSQNTSTASPVTDTIKTESVTEAMDTS